MFEELLPSPTDEEKLPYDVLVDRTEGYSGSDIRLLCKETAMQPLRRLMASLEDKEEVVPEDGMNFIHYFAIKPFSSKLSGKKKMLKQIKECIPCTLHLLVLI